MPVTASTLVHRVPARAWGLPAILIEGGLGDPLKGWTRQDAGVDRAGAGLQLIEMHQAPQTAQVSSPEPVEVEMCFLPSWAPQKVLPPHGRVVVNPDE